MALYLYTGSKKQGEKTAFLITPTLAGPVHRVPVGGIIDLPPAQVAGLQLEHNLAVNAGPANSAAFVFGPAGVGA